jgi:outer membrane lipase/esterase
MSLSPIALARPRRRSRPGLRLGAALIGLALLASCGGGTAQYNSFVPLRLFAFGDEASAMTTTAPVGRNYGINGLNGNGTVDTGDDTFDCTLQPNWVQALAFHYGFFFAECNASVVAEPQAFNLAAAGARVADVEAQVDAQVAVGGFRDKDVATVLVGVNDVVDLYRQYDGSNEAALTDEVRARGNRTAAIVNRLIALGAKVIVSNIPDMGLTPLAKAEQLANTDIDRAALLSRLSAAFNERVGVSILLDGRYVALVQMDQRVQAISRLPSSFSIIDAADAACTTPPPDCTSATLLDGASATNYLWAGDTLLSYGGQVQLATLAITRADRNPF